MRPSRNTSAAPRARRVRRLGHDDVTISSIDLDGVNLAAAKTLARRTEQLARETRKVQALEGEVDRLQGELEALKRARFTLKQRETPGAAPGAGQQARSADLRGEQNVQRAARLSTPKGRAA